MLGVFDAEITDVRIAEKGALAHAFDSLIHLEVAPDPDYGAWSVVDNDGSRVISLPGGAIAKFESNSGQA